MNCSRMETERKHRKMEVQWGINRGCIYMHVHNRRQTIQYRRYYHVQMVSIFYLINIV